MKAFSLCSRAVVLAVSIAAGAAAFFLLPIKSANAAGDDVRTLAAEIVVMKADGKRIFSSALSKRHRGGEVARLRGSLAILPLLIMAARDKSPSLPAIGKKRLELILRALDKNDGAAVTGGLGELAAAYPFDTTGLLPPDNRPAARRRAKSLYKAYCASCHEVPDLTAVRPAWNLFKLARSVPPTELAARLVNGVRGDVLTGLDNPLRNSEISALISYYLGNKTNSR
ncbi:MAG TPA: cytochrome c [Alphaproteobacteria bacterium]|nr:cytochrome c [Alphaproteobacteria bacterium]